MLCDVMSASVLWPGPTVRCCLTGGMPQVCRSNAASFAAGPMSVALSPGDADQGIIRTERLTKVYKGADFRLLTIERGEWGL